MVYAFFLPFLRLSAHITAQAAVRRANREVAQYSVICHQVVMGTTRAVEEMPFMAEELTCTYRMRWTR